MRRYADNFAKAIEWSPTQHSIPWENLRSFSLLSCRGSLMMLDCLGRYFRTFQPALETFNFRYERLDAAQRDSLDRFLSSFSGLKHVSILYGYFQSRGDALDPSSFAIAHGKTLRTIALEQREAYQFLPEDEYDGALAVICQHCPVLEVLSVPLQQIGRTTVARWKVLAELGSLKVLHNRVALWNLRLDDGIDNWAMEVVDSITDELNEKQLAPSLQNIIVGNSEGLGYELVPVHEPWEKAVFWGGPELQFFNIAYSKVDEGPATNNRIRPSTATCTRSYVKRAPLLLVMSEDPRFGSLDACFPGA